MASLQRLVISVLLILTVTFVFFSQVTEAAKGPKITHKVLPTLSCKLCG
jgi:peptidyl-prolyl cis-trans isomerase B (cyclophilin B)